MNLASCCICNSLVDHDDLNSCGCGNLICPACPSTACCLPAAGVERELCVRIRNTALELAPLRIGASLLGLDSLTPSERSRLQLLTDVLASLRNEWCVFDEQRELVAGELDG